METNEQGIPGYYFYNAGKRIDEQWCFSISQTSAGYNPEDGEGRHSLGKFNFLAPEREWFFIPGEIQSGNETLRVNFPDDARRKFGNRGVVMLDPKYKLAGEDPDKDLSSYPIAPTRELVEERAAKLWDGWLETICSQHFEDVQNAMAQGNRPRAAAGFTVHALKLKGYKDPAAEYLLGLREGQSGKAPQAASSPELLGLVKGMQQQNQLMMTILMALASGEKIDPELIKNAMTPGDTAVPPKVHKPVAPPENAGVVEVEGSPASSLEARIGRRESGYETAGKKFDDRKARTQAAAKEL